MGLLHELRIQDVKIDRFQAYSDFKVHHIEILFDLPTRLTIICVFDQTPTLLIRIKSLVTGMISNYAYSLLVMRLQD